MNHPVPHSRRKRRREPSPDRPAPARLNSHGPSGLLRRLPDIICDLALSTCLLAVPLTMAGIREYGIAIFLFASLVMAAAWAARYVLFSGHPAATGLVLLLMTAAIGLVILQLKPLPDDVLARLSPFRHHVLSSAEADPVRVLTGPSWTTVSLTPRATRDGLILLIAYCLFFVSLLHHLETPDRIQGVLKRIALSAVLMAGIGLGQALFGNDRFLWMFEHPGRFANWPAKGTFTNQNHFAQFLALGIGPLVWWWFSLQNRDASRSAHDRVRPAQRTAQHRLQRQGFDRISGRSGAFLAAGTALVALAVLMSLSRGGIAAFVLAAAVTTAGLFRSRRAVLKLLLPSALFVMCAIAAFGTDQLEQRWKQIRSAESLQDIDAARIALWTADIQAIKEFWPLGSGIGSHADVYPLWLANRFGVRFSHAENGYLQIFLEAGLPGFLILASCIALIVRWIIAAWRQGTPAERPVVAAVSAGLLASGAQSLVDFVWYIPACMITTLALTACLCRLRQQQVGAVSDNRHPRPSVLPALTAGLLLAVVLPVGQLFARQAERRLATAPLWKAYRTDIRRSVEDAERGDITTLNSHLDTLIDRLERCLAADPSHHQAAAALAPLYLQRFEQRLSGSDNAMTLSDLRETVRTAEFGSLKEMHGWLAQVCGENLHDLYRAHRTAGQALAVRPLRGESYVILAETGFLRGLSDSDQQALIRQAVRLRPYEPRILFACGLLLAEIERPDAAWILWRRAARMDRWVARQVVTRFIRLLPVGELIERLNPSSETFVILFDALEDIQRTADARYAAAQFASRYAERPAELSDSPTHLADCARLFLAAGQAEQAVACIRQALHRQPHNVLFQRQLAAAAVRLTDPQQARRHLRWLQMRLPDDPAVKRALAELAPAGHEDDDPHEHNGTPIRAASDTHAASKTVPRRSPLRTGI